MVTGKKQIDGDIERYLFLEMPAGEQEAFEEKMFVNDDLFIEVADAENRLVDKYAAGDIAAADAIRFERSLDHVPARREKLANARSLSEFIAENRPIIAVPEPRPSFLDKLAALFTIRTPAFGMAAAALVLLLLVATGVLLVRERRKESDLAKLNDLQSQLEQSRQREQELQTSVTTEREAGGDLVDELDRERARREHIERELEQLKKKPAESPESPVIASAFLVPLGGRGGSNTVPEIKIGPNTKRIAVRLALPDDITTDDRLTVRLNQKTIVRDAAPRISGEKKSINVSVSTAAVSKGRNNFDVRDNQGRAVSDYAFSVVEK
jgi:hypothetical protein